MEVLSEGCPILWFSFNFSYDLDSNHLRKPMIVGFHEQMSFFSCSFSWVLLVIGCPELSSSWTNTWLSLKRAWHPKTYFQLKECPRKVQRSTLRIFETDLPTFMQNLMQACCSVLSATVKMAEPFQCYRTSYNRTQVDSTTSISCAYISVE